MGRMDLLSHICNPATGQVEGYCIVKSVQQKTNAKGADYLDFMLCDAGGEINAKLWDYSTEQHGSYSPDTVIKVRASVNIWKETEQLKIDRIRNLKAGEEGEIDLGALIPCAPLRGEDMYEEIYRTAEGFQDNDLRMLTQYLLKENREKLLLYPAALKLHHAMRSGLLYHSLTMLRTAKQVLDIYAPLYPSLSRELVYAGVILHDIAKCVELSVGNLGLASGYSPKGQLIGHINAGVSMIERASAELMINEETTMLMEHILLSHHSIPDYGSPKPPMFPEAEIVSQLDVLDSRLFEMFDALGPVGEGEFTERQWALDNRQLYKHGHV